ncbi:MAG: T9SS type A sorting domain-containing protein [Prolixibacteraceae bacterium]|jgi:archaellum component FlaF (FlaF/FlaG flagellin family)|nr:T9SS type A sorting domain-containing protein [Prolixibacteraceae bacterium]
MVKSSLFVKAVGIFILVILFPWNSKAQNAPTRIEAENFENIGDFIIENKAGASEYKVIRAASENEYSVATTTFAQQSGIYTINVAYLDEGDGASSFNVLVNGTLVSTWIGDQIPKDDDFVIKNIQGVVLNAGQTIQLQAKRNDGEWGRIDYVDFVLESSNDGSSFIFEAEESELNNMVFGSELDEYTGIGYIESTGLGSSISFTIENDSTSFFNLKIRYQNNSDNNVLAYIESNLLTIDLNFIPTTKFDGWQEQILTLEIAEGTHVITLAAIENAMLPAVDRVLLQRTNPVTVNPTKVNSLLPQNKIVLDNAFTLMWLGTENAQFYHVYFSEDQSIDETDLYAETALTYLNVEKQTDATYYWRIDAVNEAGIAVGSVRSIIFKANPSVYYVSPDGNNSNTGSLDEPFLTITKALTEVLAGDTIFIRGGEYRFVRDLSINNLGAAQKMISIFAYQNEKVVFMNSSNAGRGIEIGGEYIHLKGINVTEAGDNGIYIDGHHNTIELCNTYKNGDSGIQLSGGASHTKIINCDSYLNFDVGNGGENADGFAAKFDLGDGNQFIACRAWSNSDDGWDFWQAEPRIYMEGCWAFSNGYNNWGITGFNGDGNAFKLGGDYYKGPHKIVRCVAFNNRGKGFDQNHNMAGNEIIHCTSYNNGVANFRLSEDPNEGIHRLVNNLSFSGGINMASTNDEITNSWNGFEVSADDFASLDTTGVTNPRNSDGSLPDLFFLKLRIGSDLLDAGSEFDWDFEGAAPDLGAYEGAFEKQDVAVREYENDAFICYPNPATDQLTIRSKSANELAFSIEIKSLTGELYYQEISSKRSAFKLDVSSYSPGLYLLTIQTELGYSCRKIVIQ